MCRFLAYLGAPVFLEEIITKPCHSLIHQSLHASEAKTVTNGDGFGLGWYGERSEPGIYRELRPAWSDENLLALCRQVRSHAFFAHIRAATGTATTRANCHPFSHGRSLFMHNGQIGCYPRLKRRLENMLPEELYLEREGTTDSELLFLNAVARGAESDPVAAFDAVLSEVVEMMRGCGICEPLRFAATFTDGTALHAFRWASDDKAPTLYWRRTETAFMVASEPIDSQRESWTLVPQGSAITGSATGAPALRPFRSAAALAA